MGINQDASSACVYKVHTQRNAHASPLTEEDAYPALPESGYGWERLFSERMCQHFEEDFGLQCRIARFHDVYGPMGTFDGGREKAPATLCRKVLEAKAWGKNEIEIWGDGEQSRSSMYIDGELVTINQLVNIFEDMAGVKLRRRYRLDAPKGVNGRNSDNTRIQQHLNWEPSIRLEDGMEKTYQWIARQMPVANRAAELVAHS